MITVDLNGAALLDYCPILESLSAKNHIKLSSCNDVGCSIMQRINIMSKHWDGIGLIVNKIGLERVDIQIRTFLFILKKIGKQ